MTECKNNKNTHLSKIILHIHEVIIIKKYFLNIYLSLFYCLFLSIIMFFITCDTNNYDIIVIEAYPTLQVVRPNRKDPDNPDQKWAFDYIDNKNFLRYIKWSAKIFRGVFSLNKGSS